LFDEEAGLVHMVDNAREGIKHTCNCCGCCCWSVGTIRRKKIPRDVLMATYFLRETDHEKCTGCGECVEICPVSAVKLVRKSDAIPPKDFKELHQEILKERKPAA
jgi:formate hydrogenlyase subunit 6/NADH:ubiquinone oxidoreductase subunit I